MSGEGPGAPLVLDANIAVKWVSDEEHRDLALALYKDAIRTGREVIRPSHFEAEVANAIWRKVERGILEFDEGIEALADFATYRTISVMPERLFAVGFDIARSLRLAALYDSIYVALAQIVGCEMWTADSRLVNAASGLPVSIRLLSTYSGF